MTALTSINASPYGKDLPADGNVVLTFSAPVFAGSGSYSLYDDLNRLVASGGAASGHVTINGNVVTIDFPSDLQFKTIYRMGHSYDWLTDASGAPVSFGVLSFMTKSSDSAVNLVGTGGNDRLAGSSQDDTLDGAGGNDSMDGYEGNDTLAGGAGNDGLDGGPGNDSLSGGPGNDRLDGNEGDDVIDGGDGDDAIYDRYGNNILSGGAGNDRIESTYLSRSVIDGGDGNDEIWGYSSDAISGGSGDDVIFVYGVRAANGRGTIHAGDGADHITVPMDKVDGAVVNVWGEGGIDTYELRTPKLSGAATLIIRDFTPGPGGDVLNVHGLGDSDARGNPFGPGGELRLEQDGADTVLVLTSKNIWTSTFNDQMVRLAGVQASQLTRENFLGNYSPAGGGTEGMVVEGTDGKDSLNGGALNDRLVGGGGADSLHGGYGDDVLEGGLGDDRLDGGPGLDIAVMGGKFADFTIARYSGDTWTTAAKVGSDWRDYVTGVERLQFTDKMQAIDLDGVGGETYRIYQAAFDRQPDAVGLGFWMAQGDRGVSLKEMAAGFANSEEFRSLYGATPSNDALVSRIYKNVLHRDADASGKAFWVDVLDRKAASVADVLIGFSESGENIAAVAKIIGNGFEYTPWAG